MTKGIPRTTTWREMQQKQNEENGRYLARRFDPNDPWCWMLLDQHISNLKAANAPDGESTPEVKK